jgi:hypothetical protein
MLALSLAALSGTAIALYSSTKIQDDVFKIGMYFAALTFILVTLICAPWILKLSLVAIPLIIGTLNSWSAENFN